MMGPLADTHVFGSDRGYRTLASSSHVIPAEIEELAVFGFGQTGSEGFLQGLATIPTAYGRPLRSGRFAITRCFRGLADDAGRATLLLCTLVLRPKDYTAIARAGLESILHQVPDVWRTDRFESGERIEVPESGKRAPRSVRRGDLVILDAWLTTRNDVGSVSVFSDAPDVAWAILGLAQVLHPDDLLAYRWGVHLLSADVPVDVCTLAAASSGSGRRMVRRIAPGAPLRNEVCRFLQESLDNGSLEKLPPTATLTTSTVPSNEGSGAAPSTSVPQRSRRASRRRRPLVTAAVIVCGGAALALAVAIGVHLAERPHTAPPMIEPAPIAAAVAGGEPISARWTERFEKLVAALERAERRADRPSIILTPADIEALESLAAEIRPRAAAAIKAGPASFRDVESRITELEEQATARASKVIDRYLDLLERKTSSLNGPGDPWSVADEAALQAVGAEQIEFVRQWARRDAHVQRLLRKADDLADRLASFDAAGTAQYVAAPTEEGEEAPVTAHVFLSPDDLGSSTGSRPATVDESANTPKEEPAMTLVPDRWSAPQVAEPQVLAEWLEAHRLPAPDKLAQDTQSPEDGYAEWYLFPLFKTTRLVWTQIENLRKYLLRSKDFGNEGDNSRQLIDLMCKAMDERWAEWIERLDEYLQFLDREFQIKTNWGDQESVDMLQQRVDFAKRTKKRALRCERWLAEVLLPYLRHYSHARQQRAFLTWRHLNGKVAPTLPAISQPLLNQIDARITELEEAVEQAMDREPAAPLEGGGDEQPGN